MPIKRNASEARLVARPSPHNTSVTLFEASEYSTTAEPYGSSTPRRSKRVKRTVSEVKKEEDIEDVILAPAAVSVETQTIEEKRVAPKGRRTNTKIEEHVASPSLSLKKKKPLRMVLDEPHPAPPRWEEAYNEIKESRKKYVAPVDTMGCACAKLREVDPKGRRVSTLVSLMLSSQTKDEVTDAAVSKLRKALGGSITVEALINADESTISEAIASVGFWRRKTQYVKQAAVRLRDEFDSDVPKTVDELCSLPGVGPKMAFLCLQAAWDINDGIGVDVHVHRITNRLGWHKPPTKNPEETRLNLQSWLPRELHPEINHLLVGFGQTICVGVGPRCDECTLSNGICPSAQKTKASRTRKALQLRTEVVIEKTEDTAS
ncbi:hypothetical protein M0805_006601 [Coniferiporia weirii]|nr:hypothetical protein M0805_006601 [Coniferiporia weirii]